MYQQLIPNLQEGDYNFEVFTFDKVGNKSVKVLVPTKVYGSNYEKNLLSRPLLGITWRQGINTIIYWNGKHSDTLSVGTNVKYIDYSGNAHTLFIPRNDTVVKIDQASASLIEYTTLYKPKPWAIDTFYAPVKIGSLDTIILKNQKYPILGTNISGRWGNLVDWTTNAACKNYNGIGGFDNASTTTKGYISLDYAVAGSVPISNGKISHTFALPIGSYTFTASVYSITGTLDSTYVAVAEGESLPDVVNIANTLGKVKLTTNSMNKTVVVPFTLTQTTTISLGFVSSLTTFGTAAKISAVSLKKVK